MFILLTVGRICLQIVQRNFGFGRHCFRKSRWNWHLAGFAGLEMNEIEGLHLNLEAGVRILTSGGDGLRESTWGPLGAWKETWTSARSVSLDDILSRIGLHSNWRTTWTETGLATGIWLTWSERTASCEGVEGWHVRRNWLGLETWSLRSEHRLTWLSSRKLVLTRICGGGSS